MLPGRGNCHARRARQRGSALTVAALARLLGRDRVLHSGRLDPRRRKDGREIRHGGGGGASRGIRIRPPLQRAEPRLSRPTTSSDGSSAIAREACRGLRDPRSRPRGQAALRYARQNGIHVSPTFMVHAADPARYERWGAGRRLTPRLVQEARSPIASLYRFFAERGKQTPAKREKSSAVDAGPQPPARPSPRISAERDGGGAAPA
jgi:hypothetical protein